MVRRKKGACGCNFDAGVGGPESSNFLLVAQTVIGHTNS